MRSTGPRPMCSVDHDYTVQAAALARSKGARRFALVSSIGAEASASNFYLKVKGETERDVMAVSPPWETLEIFRPSLLLGERKELRTGERIGMALSAPIAPLMVGPLQAYRPVAARDVARAMVASLLAGEPGTHTRTYREIVRLAKALPESPR